GRRAMSDYFRAVLRPQFEPVSLPRKWRYVEQLPVNEQGKITQQSLLHLFRPVLPECEWLKRNEHEAEASLRINADLLVFDGHFPQAPLIPGVAQLHWAHSFGRQGLSIPSRFSHIEALKFQQPIVPGQQVHLTLQWNREKSMLRFSLQS